MRNNTCITPHQNVQFSVFQQDLLSPLNHQFPAAKKIIQLLIKHQYTVYIKCGKNKKVAHEV